jgi:PAS domain S-box-containing protein
MTPDQTYFLVGLVGFTALLSALHLLRTRITLGPFFGIAGVFSMMQWQLLQTGWWVSLGQWNFNAGLTLFVPVILLGAVLTTALDGLRTMRAYVLMVLTTSSAAWAFSVFRELLAQYVPLPYLVLLSNREHMAIIFGLLLAQTVGVLSLALLRGVSALASLPATVAISALCWLATYSFLNFGGEMGLANLRNEVLPMAAATLPSLLGALAYGAYAGRTRILMPMRSLRALLMPWNRLEGEDDGDRDEVVNRDQVITELRFLNRQLQQSATVMGAHLAHATYGVIVSDGKGRIREANPPAERLLGGSPLIGRPLAAALAPLLGEADASAAQLTGELNNRRWHCAGEDGDTRHIELSATPLYGEGRGKSDGVYLILKDVSELVAAEQRRLVSSRVKDIHRTGKVLTHDLSNLLIGAQAHLQKIRPQLPEGTALQSAEAVDAALAGIRDMLQQVGGGSQFGTPLLQPENLGDLLRRAVSICEAAAEQTAVRLCLNFSDDARVEVDRSQMIRVFTNLIRNAIRASRPGGKIWVSVAKQGAGYDIQIEDEGHGMSEAEIAAAFDPGFSTKGEGKGGLGLAISYLMVDAHGGQLELSPRSGGSGLCARIWLPEARVTSAALAAYAHQTVIVASSDPGLAAAVAARLEADAGCTVAEALCLEEVEAILAEEDDWQTLLLDPAEDAAAWGKALAGRIAIAAIPADLAGTA